VGFPPQPTLSPAGCCWLWTGAAEAEAAEAFAEPEPACPWEFPPC